MRQSAISYFADPVLSLLSAAGLAIFALFYTDGTGGPGVPAWLLAVVAGGALWTLVEYLVHRVIYHRVPIFMRYHMAHHAEPKAYVGAPPGLATCVIFLASFAPLAPFAPMLANGVSAGMLLGYMCYSLVHYGFHVATPARGTYLYRAWLHHSVHHYRDGKGNFGVTTSFWDRVCGTRIERPGSRPRRW